MVIKDFILVIQVIFLLLMVLFCGMSLDITDSTRIVSKKLYKVFLVLVWVCIFLRDCIS